MFEVENIDFLSSIRIFIWGNRPGLGKTKLLTYIMQVAMFQTRQNLYNFYDEVDNLNSCGYHFTKKFEHLGFTNYDVKCLGTPYPYLRSYKASPYSVGFKFKNVSKPYPSGSVFGFTEFQNYFPSSMNDYIRPEYLQKYQTSRHDNLSFVVDCQKPTDVAKKIRDLFNIYIECLSVEEIYKDGFLIGHKWKVRLIDNPLDLENYLKNHDSSLCKETYIICKWDLHRNYDSYFCKMLHYKGFENQDFEIKHFGEEDDSDMYNQPKEFFISRSQRVNDDNQNCDEVGIY